MTHFRMAFRLFGSFEWPPRPSPSQERATGMVEVFYRVVPEQAGTTITAYVRWRRKPEEGDLNLLSFVAPPDDTPRLDALDDAALDALCADYRAGFVLRLDAAPQGEGHGFGHERLVFRGAHLIDQFVVATSDNTSWEAPKVGPEKELPPPDPRWPLLPEVDSGARVRHSGAAFGAAANQYILSLCVPVAVAPEPSAQAAALGSFFMRVVYDAPETIAEIGAFDTGDLRGEQSPSVLAPMGGILEPARRRLGFFGIARDAQGTAREAFALFGGAPKGLWRAITPQRLGHLLHAAGFNVDVNVRAPSIAKPLDPIKQSIRFSPPRANRPDGDGDGMPPQDRSSTVSYRMTLGSASGGGPGDLYGEGGKIHLRLDGEIGTAIRIPENLHVDIALTTVVPDAAVWKPFGEGWRASVTMRLVWEVPALSGTFAKGDSLSFLPNPYGDPDKREALKFEDLLHNAVVSMRSARLALQSVLDGQPQSFVPELTREPDGGKSYISLFGTYAAVLGKEGNITWGAGRPEERHRQHLRLSLADKGGLPQLDSWYRLPAEPEPKLSFRAWLPSFDTGGIGADPLNNHYHLVLGFDDTALAATDGRPFARFVLRNGDAAAIAPPLAGRLGALLFSRAGAQGLLADGRSTFAFGGRSPLHADRVDAHLPKDAFLPNAMTVEVHMRLAVDTIDPIAPDRRFGDRVSAPEPLLIALPERAAPPERAFAAGLHDEDNGPPEEERAARNVSDSPFALVVTERIGGGADRQLIAEILNNRDEPSTRTWVLIATHPWSVARFSTDSIASRSDETSATVATFDSDRRVWELRTTRPRYTYDLPPMVAGESADKPRRLEIHDAADDTATPLPPPDDRDLDAPMLRRHAVEFRLAPSTRLRVRPSDLQRNFLPPEWALRDLLREVQVGGFGVALDSFVAEFVYALPVAVDTAREEGAARFARVAEIEALTGRAPLRELDSTNELLTRRWRRMADVLARRPERMEVWQNDPETPVAFAPARFTRGATFALRNTALLRHPAEDAPAGEPPSDSGGTGPRFHRRGLSGGALWPIESRNLVAFLQDDPRPAGGALERVAFSPHGGDANQEARFRDGQVRIITESRGGFLQRHKVEVIGRITCLWHRAKHVVVYERTTTPSAQFVPKEEEGNPTRSRRPIIRKVNEWVELLEPERHYPDFAQAPKRYSGALAAVRFNSRIINVDSAWAEEVGKYGWKIPLFNHGAARLRPQVYPKPSVAFVLASEGEEADATTAHECLNPEHIYFFADFETGGEDTGAWKPRVGIDYVNLPRAGTADSAGPDAATGASDDNRDAQRRKVSRIPLGYRGLTFLLGPTARRSRVNAHRSQKPVFAAAESITFMRASSEALLRGDADGIAGKLNGAVAASGEAAEVADLGLDLWPRDGAPETLEPLRAALAAFADHRDQGSYEAARRMLKSLAEGNDGAFSVDVARVAGELEKVSHAVKKVDSGLVSGDVCERLIDKARGTVRAKKLLVVEAIHTVETELVDRLPSGVVTKTQVVDRLADEVADALRPGFALASADVANLRGDVEKARQILAGMEGQLLATIEVTVAKIDEFQSHYDRDKPWSASRLTKFVGTLDNLTAAFLDDLRASVDEARQRLTTELGAFAQRLATMLATVLRRIAEEKVLAADRAAAAGKTLVNAVRSAGKAIRAAMEDLDDAIDKVSNDQAKAALQAIRERMQALADDADALATDLQEYEGDLLALITNVAATALDWIEATAAVATDLVQTLETYKDELSDVAIGTIDAIEAVAGGLTDTAQRLGLVATGRLDAVAEGILASVRANVAEVAAPARTVVRNTAIKLDELAGEAQRHLAEIETQLAPSGLLKTIILPQVRQSLLTVLAPLPDPFDVGAQRAALVLAVGRLAAEVETRLDRLEGGALGVTEEMRRACEALTQTAEATTQFLKGIEDDVKKRFDNLREEFFALEWDGMTPDQIEELATEIPRVTQNVRQVYNDVATSADLARSYADKVFDEAGRIGEGGFGAVPSNLLRLHSMVTGAPELAALKVNCERIRANFDEISEVLETTGVTALIDRFGDELKALGISLSFDRIGESLVPADISNLDLKSIIRNCGGLDLDAGLFRGLKAPQWTRDAIIITHDFDAKARRAWVQVDLDLPLPGRSNLFTFGPVQADMVKIRLVGAVRLEASADGNEVKQTGRASIGADFEVLVAGQLMVTQREAVITFTREGGLKVDIDPKKIKINDVFQFVQDLFAKIFGDDLGGLKYIKQGGVPVGVEHTFALPPISIMAGTSGVSNIQLGNTFRLLAYPDFLLANRFNLSREDAPFIFSFFIIGGTGFVQVETEYRPTDASLGIVVTAAAGGSAALGFSFGPVSGAVFMTLSVALSFQKRIGAGGGGGGLTVGLVLVVAGNVSLASIVMVCINLHLRLTYRGDGSIDAEGKLKAEVKITRFFTVKAKVKVVYQLRDGRSRTTVESDVDVEPADRIKAGLDTLKKARQQL